MEQITHKGRIVAIDPEVTTIEIVAESACASCHAKGICGLGEEKVKQVLVRTSAWDPHNVGDEVEVVLKKAMGYKEIPKDAVFTIMNDASSTTTVFGEKATVGSEEVEVGEAYKTMNIQVTPDSVGHIAYQWEGGWPNLAKGNLRNLSISSKIDGRTYMWHAPDSQSDALDLILLGGIGSGTNFVTSGPDAVDMIIRRPPGSTSVASITNKEIYSTSFTHVENTTKSVGTGFFLSETPTWEVSTGAVLGIATLTKSKLKAVSQQTEIISDKWSDSEASNNSSTYTVTDAMTSQLTDDTIALCFAMFLHCTADITKMSTCYGILYTLIE